MADTQKYYYMRLKDDYFNSPDQIYLETLPNGYLFSNILLKLYLLSLHDNGRLMFRDRIPYSVEMIASVTRHTVDTVKQALDTFESLGLIEVLDTGAMYMNDIQNFIGKSSTEADRKREQRSRMEAEKTTSTADDTESETAGETSGHFADICPDISLQRENYNQSHIYNQSKRQNMAAPSLEQIRQWMNDCATDRGVTFNIEQQARKFYNYYAMYGWKNSTGGDIQDWAAAVALWLDREKDPDQKPQPGKLWKVKEFR